MLYINFTDEDASDARSNDPDVLQPNSAKLVF